MSDFILWSTWRPAVSEPIHWLGLTVDNTFIFTLEFSRLTVRQRIHSSPGSISSSVFLLEQLIWGFLAWRWVSASLQQDSSVIQKIPNAEACYPEWASKTVCEDWQSYWVNKPVSPTCTSNMMQTLTFSKKSTSVLWRTFDIVMYEKMDAVSHFVQRRWLLFLFYFCIDWTSIAEVLLMY